MVSYYVFSQNKQSLPILSAALFAILGWIYTAYESHKNATKAHTLTILLQMRNSSGYNKHRDVVLKHLGGFEKINNKIIKQIQNSLQTDDIDIRKSVVYLSNHMEFVCAGYVTRDLYEGILIKSFRSIIINYWDSFEEFLTEEREDDFGKINPKIYENIQIAAIEMKRKRKKEGLVYSK